MRCGHAVPMSDAQMTLAQLLRQAVLEWLPPYPDHTAWASLISSRQWVDKAQLERVCTQMVQLGEIVNAHPPASGDLAAHVRRPKPPSTDRGSPGRNSARPR